MKIKGLSGAEAFLELLSAMGIDRIFASPGSEWAPVWEYLAKPDLRNKLQYLSSRHEDVAVGMASGYAKATGKLAAVMLHTTVGTLHAAMALRGALHENIPMVIFAGESTGFGEEVSPDPGPQWLRGLADVGGPARVIEHSVKWSFAVNTKAVLPATIQRAAQLAMASPRGPVFVSVPMELLFETMAVDAPLVASMPVPPAADPRGVEELAEMLLGANSPVIVTEAGGRSVQAVERLVELAELLGIPVAETRYPAYMNFPRTHPLHAGFEPLDIIREADLVFLLAPIAPWHPPSAGPRPGAKVAVLDENPLRADVPFWGYQVDLCLTGRIETSLELLLEQVRKRVGRTKPAREKMVERWRKRHEERKRQWREEALARAGQKPIDTRWVVHELNRVLPRDAVVVEETITNRLAIVRLLDRLGPGSAFSGSIGGLGTGLGTALGVKSALPDRSVICLIGDGSFNYNPVLAALGFADEYRAPILIVIFNNQGYLSQKSGIPEYYPQGWAVKSNIFVGTSITPNPDYAALAPIFGGYGEKVEDPTEVAPALNRGLAAVAAGKLALIDMRLEPVNQ